MAETTPTSDEKPQTADQAPGDDAGENVPAVDDGSTPGVLGVGPDATLDEAFDALTDEAELPDARRFKVSEEMLARLDNTFVYHGAGPDQAKRYEFIRARARAFAQVIVTLTPPSREQSLAITALEEAVMRANQAIAVNE